MALSNINMRDMLALVNKFRITAEIKEIIPIHNGHIHHTYHICTAEGTDFLLQQLNTAIFTDTTALMSNIDKVVSHLAKRHKQYKTFFPHHLQLITTWKFKPYCCAKDGTIWRMFNFIPGSKVYNRVPGPALAHKAGLAFGAFLLELSDFPAKDLAVILPCFHDFGFRHEAYMASLSGDKAGRKKELGPEIAFVAENAASMKDFNRMILAGKVPTRVTHNDTKINNVLFDASHRPLCVIDLDTVMPGSVLHDFGDAIRTACNSAEEDEPELSKVNFDLDIFRAFSKGYLEKAGPVLTEKEILSLPFSAIFMTFLIGLRFLTDYLDGDIYYRVGRPEHNLDRARVQFELARQMQLKYDDITNIIKDIIPSKA